MVKQKKCYLLLDFKQFKLNTANEGLEIFITYSGESINMVVVRPKTSCTHAVPSTTLLVFYEEVKYFTHLKCVK